MKLSIDTETEELSELRATIAIIEDAIKRRENNLEEPEEAFQEDKNFQEDEEEPEEEPEEESEPEEEFQEKPREEPKEEFQRKPKQDNPPVDLAPLAKSSYGERVEKRTFTSSQYKEPKRDNKIVVKNIIKTLRDKYLGQPIQMKDILTRAQENSISEEETRKIVLELQNSREI